MSQVAPLSFDLTILPETPTATKILLPNPTPKRVFVVEVEMLSKDEPLSVDFKMVPLSPDTTKVLFPKFTSYRFLEVEEVALSKDEPLSVDFRIFPERPATTNTPLPERLSVVEVEPVDELSLLPHEKMPEVKLAINIVYKIFFINLLNKIIHVTS